MKNLYLPFILILLSLRLSSQNVNDSALIMIPGEGWWGGVVHQGVNMPHGDKPFTFNMYGNDAGNQAVPLLISNKGRYIWSENPFRYSFRNDSVVIDNTYGDVKYGKNGNTLKDAYKFTSANFFPSSGKWVDSLLVTAPQYNLWIELAYNPTQKDVLNYAMQVLHHGFPPGVLMIDDNWSNYYGHFDFDVKKFPDPKALTDQLHSTGFKVMLWICPFISPDSEPYRELVRKKLVLMDNQGKSDANWEQVSKPLLISWWNGYSACLDLSNPEAVSWLEGKLDYLMDEYGIDGFKLDAGDAMYYKSPNLVSFKKLLPNDHSVLWAELGMKYTLNEYRAMWKMGGQPLVERLRDKSHSWRDLQTLIPNTIAQQLAGYTFTCPDMIGGGSIGWFRPGRQVDQKLVVRSAQVHALMPMMQFSAAPWRILDEENFKAVKRSVEIRQNYMTYIMQVLRNSAITGEPALKNLEYNYPGQGYERITDQFLIGDKIMVAPIVTAEDNRNIQIPGGRWKYKNTIIKGPVVKSFNVPLDEIPVFEKISEK